jgi:hypothetical protein
MRLCEAAQLKLLELYGKRITRVAIKDWVWVDADTDVLERPVSADEDLLLHLSLSEGDGIVHIRNQALYAMPKPTVHDDAYSKQAVEAAQLRGVI